MTPGYVEDETRYPIGRIEPGQKLELFHSKKEYEGQEIKKPVVVLVGQEDSFTVEVPEVKEEFPMADDMSISGYSPILDKNIEVFAKPRGSLKEKAYPRISS